VARVGCSGWSYRDWRGLVYPEQLPTSRWFACYAELFCTVELNTTFYRLPAAETVVHWAEAAPPGFTYALKLGSFGTHRRKLRLPETWLPKHLERIAALGAAEGPTVVQLPPRWKRDVGRLDAFLACAPRTTRWAVELRDPSWVHDDVFDVLRRHGAALVVHDLLPDLPWIRTTSWAYARFHGPHAVEHPYWGRYGSRRLRPRADRLLAWIDEGCDVWAYFNNDHDAAAVADAQTLVRQLGDAARRPVPAAG
jgi:uncharacterized protein YecE (DUF72 family)